MCALLLYHGVVRFHRDVVVLCGSTVYCGQLTTRHSTAPPCRYMNFPESTSCSTFCVRCQNWLVGGTALVVGWPGSILCLWAGMSLGSSLRRPELGPGLWEATQVCPAVVWTGGMLGASGQQVLWAETTLVLELQSSIKG